ncbi:MAG: hypothetical protein ACI9BW_000410 [Gammaproteobacteria bacterium]|jgi:hypothetical protein
MLLTHLQEQLSRLYETPNEYNIYDFLITDQKLADAISPPGHAANDERLLVSQSHGHLDISVYLNRSTLAHLADDDPLEILHDGNLDAFMLAIEGVSHFQYLCWNASFDKSVTLLELELQAEVDKYVTAMRLLSTQGNAADANTVHTHLFEKVSYRGDLAPQERARYCDANHYAAKYCRVLSERFHRDVNHVNTLNELRRFYRLTQNEKIRRIEHSH